MIPEPDLNSPTWPFVLAFAKRMEAKLAENRHKSGWRAMELSDILDRIDDEVEELNTAVGNMEHSEAVANECADVANFCMMIADNLTRGS